MINRMAETKGPHAKRDMLGVLGGAVVGLLIGIAATFLVTGQTEHLKPGAGACGEAAERFAQIAETLKRMSGPGITPLADPTLIVGAHAQAVVFLDQCRTES
jgi:hypothetical protein